MKSTTSQQIQITQETDKKLVESEEDLIANNENEYRFKTNIFFEFFLYHFLFYFCLGPFICPFLRLFRGKYVNQNLSFLSLDAAFFFQLLTYLSILTIVLFYFVFQPSSLYLIEVYMIVSGVILRISIISIKYATMDSRNIEKIFKSKLSKCDKSKEQTLKSWATQKECIANDEILRLLKKNIEEIPFFKINFLCELNEDVEKCYQDCFNSLKDILEKDPVFNCYDEKILKDLLSSKLKYYSGIVIVKSIISKSKHEKIPYIWCSRISCLISLLRSMIPILFRCFFDDENNNLKYSDILLIISITSINQYYFSKNCEFVIFGIYEFMRKYYNLSQISNLLSARKNEKFYTKKIYPTINLFDSVSLKSWNKIQRIIREYGEKFKIRIQAYLSLFVLFYIVVIITMITFFFLDSHIFSSLSFCILIYEVTLIIIVILIVFKKGSLINEYYSFHIILLRENRRILFDLMKFGEIYFDQPLYIPENPTYFKGVEMIKRSIECRQNRLKSFSGFILKESFKFKTRKEILKNLIKTHDEVIEGLMFEKENNLFRILGIPLTQNVYNSILTIFGSLFLAILRKILTENI